MTGKLCRPLITPAGFTGRIGTEGTRRIGKCPKKEALSLKMAGRKIL